MFCVKKRGRTHVCQCRTYTYTCTYIARGLPRHSPPRTAHGRSNWLVSLVIALTWLLIPCRCCRRVLLSQRLPSLPPSPHSLCRIMNIPNVVGVSSTRPSVRPSVRRSSSRRAYDIRILIDVLLHAPRSAMEGGKEGKREAEGGKQADTAVRQAARQPASSRSLLQSPLPLPLRLHERRRRRGASEPLLLFPLLRLCRVPQRHFPTEMIGGRVNATSLASEGSPRATTLSARRPR